MQALRFVPLLIFLAISGHGRYIGSTFKVSQSQKESLQRLLQFYRSEDSSVINREGSTDVADSIEFDTPTKLIPKFRIDLLYSGDDMIPYELAEDEIIPVGSLEKVSSSSSPQPILSTTSNSINHTVKDAHVPNVEANLPSPLEITAESSTIVEQKNPEEAENEATTMYPIVEKLNMTLGSGIVIGEETRPIQHKINYYDDSLVNGEDGDDDDNNEDEEDSEEQCKEGQTKKLKCNNTCVCVDGAYFCSKRKCDRPITSNQTGIPIPIKKVWGHRKKQELTTTPLPTCTSGMTKSIDCNKCICALGQWGCTKRKCIALSFREKASYTDGITIYNQVATLSENKELDEDCGEGSVRALDCNQCICHWNSWSCTNFTCGTTPAPKKQEIYEGCRKDGEVKTRDCNLCRCVKGYWTCSKNDCQAFDDKDDAPPTFRASSKSKIA